MKACHVCRGGRRKLRHDLLDMAVLRDLLEEREVFAVFLKKAPTKGIQEEAHDFFVGTVKMADLDGECGVGRLRLKEFLDDLGDVIEVILLVVRLDKMGGQQRPSPVMFALFRPWECQDVSKIVDLLLKV